MSFSKFQREKDTVEALAVWISRVKIGRSFLGVKRILLGSNSGMLPTLQVAW